MNIINNQTEGTSVCQIQRVRQGQAAERGVKSVARTGQGGGGRMGQTWCWPSYLKELHQARLWAARAPAAVAQGFQMGRESSRVGISHLDSGFTYWNPPGEVAFPSLHSTLPVSLTHCTYHSAFLSFIQQITQSSSPRTAPGATETPRRTSAPLSSQS